MVRRIEVPLEKGRPKYLYELVAGGRPMTDRERRIYNAGLRDGYDSRDLDELIKDSPALRKVGL